MALLIEKDTICALSTANGVGAIAVIRVSGDEALALTSKIFSKDLTKVDSHTVHFGTIRDDENKVIDEVLVTVLKEGKSFTGENTTEIACHGSTYIQQQILNLLFKAGCRMAKPGEFTMRAYFNGRMDLSQAEAIADLIASDSKKGHEIAMNQMRGGYSDKIAHLRQRLMDFASLIELELDFSEEDVEFASRTELNDLVIELKEKLTLLTESFAYGNAIKHGISTVIAGRPNAGKSTLLNALLNEERAIVSSIAGTTRDTIEEILTIDGVLYNFIDTAGIREATDEIEKIGVERAISEVSKSNILLYVFDVNELSKEEVQNDLSRLEREGLSIILLANKTEDMDASEFAAYSEEYPVIAISAKNHEGLDALKAELAKSVEELATESDTIVINARHYEAFSNALADMNQVEQALEMQISGDLLAMDIRSAIRHLSSITGEISTDDLLGNIFANFCIGK
ncbi:tRNA uridine-5-carboxymethylaminomethyl(34) synthesis GTPase MnmE [Brumimicrobium salinarum]|uniref:tRNA modification GTPase MnmE n=1 Tax=Brumimicrobium salinarum TaxID=2058658 RepID=A0A2I0R1U2_9FLAO|nr:tRNA uridine-5-carboxymethylaminomethyl(34) synthesis GTPase MnmE [Brumimicrobium salinarum]PKR80370.1 tRNA uridine-5-carboxymethylaminomethyl(34) synthesis GTPase MnmE [Brumimicrobium salinarum]